MAVASRTMGATACPARPAVAPAAFLSCPCQWRSRRVSPPCEHLGAGTFAAVTRTRKGIMSGFRCDPATAELVMSRPSSDDRLGRAWHTLGVALCLAPEGHWFTERAMTPDEAREWLEQHCDRVALQQRFPAGD